MYYVADTMALVWQLEGGRRLGQQARKILRDADKGSTLLLFQG